MPTSDHYRKLVNMYLGAPINAFYEPRLEISEGRANLEMQVAEKFFHAAGAMHGSVYFKMLDDAAFFAVHSLVEDCFIVTASFNTYLVRPVSAGTISCRGRVVHSSRRIFVAEAELVDDAGRQLARGSGTFMKTEKPLTAEMGYR